MLSELITLIGVALGFFLGVGYKEYRDWRERSKQKEALRNELRTNLHMVPQKRQTIEDIIAALNSGHLLFGDSVRFIDTFYTSYFSSVAPYLSVKERNSLHLIYEYFRVVDSLMETYVREITEVLDTDEIDFRIQVAKTMMSDLIKRLAVTEDLIKEHLKGEPKDVFHVGR
jgi:hypothetical protein